MNFCDAIKMAWLEDKAIRPMEGRTAISNMYFCRNEEGAVIFMDELENPVVISGLLMELEWEVVE